MSSQQSSNENLSSYFDHEVSPEERKKLESLLETSAEARQELHEIGEISRLLQETATELAPPELAPSIRRRIEQETLLAKSAQPVVKRGPSAIRYRVAVTISACSSMAALVLFVLLMNSYKTPIAQLHSDLSPAKSASSLDLPEVVATRENFRSSDSLDFDGMNKKMAALPAAPTAVADNNDLSITDNLKSDKLPMKKSSLAPALSSEKKHGTFSVRNSINEEEQAKIPSRQLRAGSKSRSEGFPEHIPLDTVRIGDALPYFRDIDGKVAVIEVRVVDVQQALGTMELLLARNNIPVNQQKQSEIERQTRNRKPTVNKAKESRDQSTAQKSGDDDTELFAVYVEATDKQLAAALQDFQKDLKRDQFVSLALQPAISEASLSKGAEKLPDVLAYHLYGPNDMTAGKSETKKNSGSHLNGNLKRKVSTGNKSNTKIVASADSKMDRSKDQRNNFGSSQTLYRMQIPADQIARSTAMKRAASKLETVFEQKKKSTNMPLTASKPTLGFSNTTQKGRALGTSARLSKTNQPIKVLFVFKNSTSSPTSSSPE